MYHVVVHVRIFVREYHSVYVPQAGGVVFEAQNLNLKFNGLIGQVDAARSPRSKEPCFLQYLREKVDVCIGQHG